MKKCVECGAECGDETVTCPVCGVEQLIDTAAVEAGDGTNPRRYSIPALPAGQKERELVTLIRCRTLAEADFIVSDLKAAGIEALVPDQFMIEAGSYRVQVSPQDHETARQLLNEER